MSSDNNPDTPLSPLPELEQPVNAPTLSSSDDTMIHDASSKSRRGTTGFRLSSLNRESLHARKDAMLDSPLGGRRISTRDINFGIPSNMAAREHVAEQHGTDSRKSAALRFLHQKWVQMTFLALLILDVLILFTELLLMSGYPTCRIIVRDCIACCPSETDNQHVGRVLAGHGHAEEVCEAGYQDTGIPSCDEHKWHAVHTAEKVMFWLTILILSTFFVENLVEIWALSPCIFFRQLFYALDFLVITISLTLELTFHLASNAWLEELAGFIVFFRLWRFVRIGHGIVEATSELTHELYDALLEYASQCEDQLELHGLKFPSTTKQVHNMVDQVRDEH